MRRRAATALGLVAILAWCLLLFGIGLDDLTNAHTEPGVIVSVVLLVVLIPALLYAIWRAVRPAVARRTQKTL